MAKCRRLCSPRAIALAMLTGRTFDGQQTPIYVVPFSASASATLPQGCCRPASSGRAHPESCARFARFGALAAAAIAPAAGVVVGFLLFEYYHDAHFRTDGCKTLHGHHCGIAGLQGGEPRRAGK
jgi:hypothetical protein